MMQVWLFASPIAYSAALVPDELRVIYQLNPMAGVIEGFRWALLAPELDPPIGPILLSAVISSAVLAGGLWYFRRVERTFTDVI
jgi:lipopolysaccharide transport system permease protein